MHTNKRFLVAFAMIVVWCVRFMVLNELPDGLVTKVAAALVVITGILFLDEFVKNKRTVCGVGATMVIGTFIVEHLLYLIEPFNPLAQPEWVLSVTTLVIIIGLFTTVTGVCINTVRWLVQHSHRHNETAH